MAHKIVYSAEGLDPREAFDDWFARVCLVKDSPTAFILVNLEKGEGRVPGLLARGRSLLISTVYPAVQEISKPFDGLLAAGSFNIGRNADFLNSGQLVRRHGSQFFSFLDCVAH